MRFVCMFCSSLIATNPSYLLVTLPTTDLWSGVQPFLKYLSKKVSSADLNPELLVGLYIPNLIVRPPII